jgi:hypothetical protein
MKVFGALADNSAESMTIDAFEFAIGIFIKECVSNGIFFVDSFAFFAFYHTNKILISIEECVYVTHMFQSVSFKADTYQIIAYGRLCLI